MVNLLQCRPLQTPGLAGKGGHDRCVSLDAAALAQRDISRVMLRLDRNTMGPQLDCQVDAVIIVDPRAYYELPYRNKPSVAALSALLTAITGTRAGVSCCWCKDVSANLLRTGGAGFLCRNQPGAHDL